MKKVVLMLGFWGVALAAAGQNSYWENLPQAPGGYAVNILETKSGMLFAGAHSPKNGTFDDPILNRNFVSKDTGRTWQHINLPAQSQLGRVFVGQSGRLYFNVGSTETALFYVSEDGGETWSQLNLTPTFRGLTDNGNGSMFGCRKTSTSKMSFLRSDDNGATWVNLTTITAPSSSTFKLEFDVQGRLFFGLNANINMISFDEGASFENFPTSESAQLFTYLNTRLHLGSFSEGFIYRQPIDSSTSEQILVDTSNIDNSLTSITQLRDSSILVKGYFGVYKSTDDGKTWQKLPNSHIAGEFASSLQLTDGSLPLLNFESLWKADPQLAHFEDASAGLDNGRIRHLLPEGDSIVYASTTTSLLKKAMGDTSWQVLKFANGQVFTHFRKVVDHHFILAATDSLYLFDDLAHTFEAVPNPVSGQPAVFDYSTYLTPNPLGPEIYLVEIPYKGAVQSFVSTDLGQTWNLSADSFLIYDIQPHPSGSLFAHASWGSLSGILKSVDAGLTWQIATTGYPYYLVIGNDGTIYTGSSFSHDNGATWGKPTNWQYFPSVEKNSLGHFFGFDTDIVRQFQTSVDNGISWANLPDHGFGNALFNCMAMSSSQKLYGSVYDGNEVNHVFRTRHSTVEGAFITGLVQSDADADCSTPDPSGPLKNWLAAASKGLDTWYANTDTSGRYRMFVDTGSYAVSVRPPLAHLLWEACDDTLSVALPTLLDTTEADFLVKKLADCPYLGVDLAVEPVVPCFETYGAVSWCNYGTEAADSASLDLSLDPLLRLTYASLAGDSLGGGLWRFPLGKVEADECGTLWFAVVADCDSTVVGQAVCLSAHIWPDSLCVGVPGWSGALIRVTATCASDTSVDFEIKNIGPATSQPLEYIIVEDDVVLKTTTETWDPLESKTEPVSMPTGHFVRLVSEQEPGYPLGSRASAFSVNCGGPTLSPAVHFFPLDDGPAAVDHECTTVVASFDPNEKLGQPLGFGPAHLVERGTDIEYTIFFQNTGTAAAHFVTVRDTLSDLLDPMSIRIGAASHPFSWKLDGQGFLTFRFDDINLPDSAANEAASHGFVSFKISQKPGLPDGTTILNRAAIYFDYNGSVETNQTLHRIGHDFLAFVDGPEIGARPTVSFYPNPLGESAMLTFDGLKDGVAHRLLMTDATGKTARSLPFYGKNCLLRRDGMASGAYFLEVRDAAGKAVFSGKMLLD